MCVCVFILSTETDINLFLSESNALYSVKAKRQPGNNGSDVQMCDMDERKKKQIQTYRNDFYSYKM